MSDARSQRGAGEPSKRTPHTISEASRERWTPGQADAQEAGDDGPHRTAASDDTVIADDRNSEAQP